MKTVARFTSWLCLATGVWIAYMLYEMVPAEVFKVLALIPIAVLALILVQHVFQNQLVEYFCVGAGMVGGWALLVYLDVQEKKAGSEEGVKLLFTLFAVAIIGRLAHEYQKPEAPE